MSSESPQVQKSKIQVLTEMLLSNWHFMRWLRLVLGLYLVWQAARRPDIFTGLVAAFFLFQAITNTGCCGAAGCTVPRKKPAEPNTDEAVYEEIR